MLFIIPTYAENLNLFGPAGRPSPLLDECFAVDQYQSHDSKPHIETKLRGWMRDEIIESQKARADLFKWKIIPAAAIRAAALGAADPLGGSARAGQDEMVTKREYLLCLAPLVCVYTDILCAHMNLLIRIIR